VALMLRVLSLFAGIGGFDLGLERTGGFKSVRAIEINEDCQAVLRARFPQAVIDGDILQCQFQEGEADVICGGFPCQDISVAGKRAGLAGERSGLWSEVVRALGVVRPRYAIFENSERLTTGDDGRWFAVVLGDLAALGYDVEWHCIPASYVGAPHERDRVWIIAADAGCAIGRDGIGLLSGWGQQLAREAKAHPADNNNVRELQPQGRIANVRGWALHCAERTWPQAWHEKLSALRGMDDGVSRRLDARAAAPFGNAVVPQIPELIGRAILASLAEQQEAA
jgi:DNA (cytosine-5)-methyltransferase 1